MKRLSVGLAVVLGIGSLFLANSSTGAYLWYQLRPDYPTDESQQVPLDALFEPVQIHFDEWGIAHIDAKNEHDLVRAVGWVHGRDRFFQMDAMRRIAQGRLSALVGEKPFMSGTTVDLDRTMHGWGFGRLAQQDLDTLPDEARELLAAYADGVNAAAAQFEPIEYRLLGAQRAPWRIEDSMAVARLNAWTVTHNWHQEASRLLIALHAGVERSEAIYTNEPWKGEASLPPQGAQRPLPVAVAPELRELLPPRPAPERTELASRGLESDLAGHTSASNAWVVGGARSRSGAPIVANDPHMSLVTPALLQQLHLRTPDLDVIGFTIPGLPYILMGHNRDVAWGMTASVADAIDLTVEKQNPDDPGQVLGPDGWYDLEVVPVRIEVADQEGVRASEVRISRNGPLLQDVYPNLLPEWAPLVSIRWESGNSGTSLLALARVNRSKNLQELRESIGEMTVPITVWTAADRHGATALLVNGRTPIRKAHRGTFPAPGWLAKYDWKGRVPLDQMPGEFGGADSVYIHSNNLIRSPAHSDVVLNVDSAASYRRDRVRALIDATEKHDIDSFRQMQADQKALRGERLAPQITADLALLADLTPHEAHARKALADWDFVSDEDSLGTLVFFATYRQGALDALEDEVDGRARAFLMSQRYFVNCIDDWYADPQHPVWDDRRTPAVEGRAIMVQRAFRTAVAWIAAEQGEDPSQWRWGRAHESHVNHFFGGVAALADMVNMPVREIGGAIDTVWKSHFDLGHPDHPFQPMAGPAIRMVVDLGDVDHGWWISSTGASGWPRSPHYADQHDLWLRGELIPMRFDWEEIRAKAVGTVTLK